MSHRRRILSTLAISVTTVSVVACSSATSRPVARPTTTTTRATVDGTLTLGQLAPLTGPIATIADSFTVPVKLAVDEMNFSGGINGKPVALAVADDGSSSTTATAAFNGLVDTNRVDAIIGPSTSQLALGLIDAARTRSVVMCSGSNSYGPISTAAARSGFYFRTAPPDRLQADALGALLVGDGRHRPVILTPRDSYGVPFATELVHALRVRRVRGASIVAVTSPEADATRVVDQALARQPDAIVLIGFPATSAPILKALIARGKGPLQIPTYGSDGLQSADLGALVDPAKPAVVASMRGTTPAGAPAGIDHPFNARLFATGVEGFFSASTYDCAVLVGLAAVAGRSDDPRRIRDHFATNLTGKVSCTTFLECSGALKAHKTIHYRGASSAFDRWQGTEPGTGTYDVWTLGLDARPALASPGAQIHVP